MHQHHSSTKLLALESRDFQHAVRGIHSGGSLRQQRIVTSSPDHKKNRSIRICQRVFS
jgi:hypothetical protein